MGRRQALSPESVSSLIADIYDAATDARCWPAVLKRLSDVFDAPRATIWLQDVNGGSRAMQTLEQDDAISREYRDYYGAHDPMRPAILKAPHGTVLTTEMVVNRQDFARSEFYTDFAARHGFVDSIQARIFDGDRSSGVIGISGALKSGAFGREHVRLLRVLQPHLSRAIAIQGRLTCALAERDLTLGALDRLHDGVLVVDARMHVLHANLAAEIILRTGDGLGLEPNSRLLRASSAKQTTILRRMIGQASGYQPNVSPEDHQAPAVLQLERAIQPPLYAAVSPLRARSALNFSPWPAALLLVSVVERSSSALLLARLRTLYGLTPAEAAVAGRIGRAETVAAASRGMGITPTTLRSHLQRIFQKTGTARQAELVRLVERLTHLDAGGG